MDWMEMLQAIFTVVVIPLLGILTKYLVSFIGAKCKELQARTDNELYDKYIIMLQDTVVDCVLTTTQTYVEALKNKNVFDAEAQKTAFEMTKTAVLNILTEDAKEYLTNVLGDFDQYLTILIESQVHLSKQA